MSTIQPDPPDQQNEIASSAGPTLSAIVVAVLDFFRPTIFDRSWTPWLRAMIAVALLTIAVVAVVLSVTLT